MQKSKLCICRIFIYIYTYISAYATLNFLYKLKTENGTCQNIIFKSKYELFYLSNRTLASQQSKFT